MARFENLDVTVLNLDTLKLKNTELKQASKVDALSTITANDLLTDGSLDATKVATVINTIINGINAVLTALKNAGTMAST